MPSPSVTFHANAPPMSNCGRPDEQAVIGYGRAVGIDLTSGACTPAQAIKRGIDENIVEQFCVERTTSLALTKVDVNKLATEVFGKVK